MRTLHVVTALVTVWCLGCAALDPLISTLGAQPRSALMDCASGRGAVAGTNVGSEPVVRAPASGDEQGSASCDCQSCFAPAPAATVDAPSSSMTPDDLARVFTAPASVERAPLVPPPQAVA